MGLMGRRFSASKMAFLGLGGECSRQIQAEVAVVMLMFHVQEIVAQEHKIVLCFSDFII